MRFSYLHLLFSLSKERQSAAKQLLLVMDVINQTVGDALSDLLLVETILHAKGWSISDWDNAYTDLPNRQMKVKISLNTQSMHTVLHVLDGRCAWLIVTSSRRRMLSVNVSSPLAFKMRLTP